MNKFNTQVVIVGAGPTGLMAANQLMRFGIDFIIIDSKSGPTIESRAIAITARSMELYQQMKLDDEVLTQAKPIDGVKLYSNGKKKVDIIVESLGKNYSDFNHFLLAFEQNKNESLLYKNLLHHGKDVHWNTPFIKFIQDEKSLIVIAEKENSEITINAKYLIACDGAKSPVRHQTNMPFKGGTYENKFFVADTAIKWNLPFDKLIVAPSNNQFVAFFPISGINTFRIVGTIPSELNEKEDLTFDDIKNHITNAMKMNIAFEKVNWFSLYKLHHRCVERFSDGRVFLAGDAAHIHSPAGGQGMNTGLQDVHNLAWKLTYVLKGYKDESFLNTYHEERKPFAEWLLKFTDRGFTFITSNNKIIQIIRHYLLFNIASVIMKWDFVKHTIFKNISQTFYHYQNSSITKPHQIQDLKFKAGIRLPYVHHGYYKSFTAATHYLIHINNAPLNDELKKLLTAKYNYPITIIENTFDIGWEKFGVAKETFILVRPDMYVEEVWH